MKLLVDSCVAATAKIVLAHAGHEAESVADWPHDPGDLAILAHATEHQQSVVTLDKDFGELAIVRGTPARIERRLISAGRVRMCANRVVAGAHFKTLLPDIGLRVQSRVACGRPNHRSSRLAPKWAFSATSASDGSWNVPVGFGPLRKSTSTRPTRSWPNST